ncbi:hypothetical protein KY289_000301 [Solanum tuberosum]|nr:hypothetical protein KY289_000301 [Solanum tuberosum]
MDLSSNGFSGNLPASLFENFQAMKIIDQNITTPAYVGGGSVTITTKGLVLVFVRVWINNVGHIPASLQHLSVLESLDLSSNEIGGGIPQQLVSLTSLEVLNLSHNHLVGCIPKGNQFNTFENSSYQGNDGLCGLPLSKDCGGDDGVLQATTPFGLDDEEEEDSAIISWQAVLMGYGCGLVIGLSIIYIMLSTQYPAWFSRMDIELEHIIIKRMKRHNKRY